MSLKTAACDKVMPMNTAQIRRNMVNCQLQTNGVASGDILAAFEAVPREAFVPENLRGVAYVDEDLRLPDGNFLIEPLVLARMLQAAEPQPHDRALVIGDATGYAAAILSRLARTVPAEAGPFSLVVLAGAAGEIPRDLLDILAPGGRLVCVVRPAGQRTGKITLVKKDAGGVYSTARLQDAAAPYVKDYAPQPGFEF